MCFLHDYVDLQCRLILGSLVAKIERRPVRQSCVCFPRDRAVKSPVDVSVLMISGEIHCVAAAQYLHGCKLDPR